MISIAICEDELNYKEKTKEELHRLLKSKSITYNVFEYSSGEELLNEYPKNLDILIMDIQLKLINGMETARKIRKFDENVEIIFMTSFAEYMQDGYEVKAYRYLLKPITQVNLSKHILPCIDEIVKKRTNYLTLNLKDNLKRINIDSIVYIETDRPNILIHTYNDIYTIRMSISKIEKILSEYKFFRCHNSYIINLKLVESMDKNSITLNNKQIPVSKYRVKSLKKAITNVLGDLIC